MGNITNTVDSSWQAAGVMLQGTEKRGRKNKSKQIFTVVYISGDGTIVVSGVEGYDTIQQGFTANCGTYPRTLCTSIGVFSRVCIHQETENIKKKKISDYVLNATY